MISQVIYINDPKRQIQLQPGDILNTVCEFNSSTTSTDTVSGYGSSDEMCQAYLYATPAIRVQQPFAYSINPVLQVNNDTGVIQRAPWA